MITLKRKLLLSTAIAAVSAGSVSAQEESDAGARTGTLEEIVITGARRALHSAADLKQGADQIADAITADDLGNFPDTNIAESLQRIPGVQLLRNGRGEGNGYVINGVTDIATTVNGRQIFSQEGRYGTFLDFSSDLLSGITVYKTTTADQIEGGLGGIIDVRTARPFDFEGMRVGASAEMAHSEFSSERSPGYAGLFSNRWNVGEGEMGFSIGGQYEAFRTGAYRTNTNNYSTQTGLFDVNGNGSLGDAGDAVTLPTTINLRYEQGDRLRASGFASLQWRPNDNLDLYTDLMYWKSRGRSSNQNMQTLNTGDGGVGVPTFKGNTDLAETFSFENVTLRNETAETDNPYDVLNVAVGGTQKLGDLELSFDVSYTRSDHQFWFHAVQSETVAPRVNVDMSGDTPFFGVEGTDLSNPAIHSSSRLNQFMQDGVQEMPAVTIDASYEVEGTFFKGFDAGVRWAEISAEKQAYFVSNAIAQEDRFLQAHGLSDNDLFSDQSLPTNQWAIIPQHHMRDLRFLRDLAGQGPQNPEFQPGGGGYDFTEETVAGYVKGRFEFMLGDFQVDGNAGIRLIDTSTEQEVFEAQTDGSFKLVSGGGGYSDVLPSVNLRVELTPDLYLRLGYYKSVRRPNISDLSPAVVIDAATNNSATGGNPDLEPLTATNFDASLEYYFARSSYTSLALFRKNVDGYFQRITEPETLNGEIFQVNRVRNSGDGVIEGFVLAHQQFFDFLPAPFNGLGVQASYTHVSNELDIPGFEGRQPATNLAENSFGLTGLYEIGNFSSHISYNWREKSLDGLSSDPNNIRWNAPRESLDLSVSYKLTEEVVIKADVSNLTRSYDDKYYGNDSRPFYSNQWDRLFQVGIRAMF